jgi:hypothetical protein
MKQKITVGISLVIFIFASIVISQEKTTQTIELPQKTLEYKVERGVINTLSWIFAGIAYAKSKGDTPEDFARYGLNVWGSFWKDIDLKEYIQKWHRIFSTDFQFKMEILSATDTSVETRMTIFAQRCAKTFAENDVTEDDYIRFIKTSVSSMAEYLGWECKQKLEDDWLYFTVSEKE